MGEPVPLENNVTPEIKTNPLVKAINRVRTWGSKREKGTEPLVQDKTTKVSAQTPPEIIPEEAKEILETTEKEKKESQDKKTDSPRIADGLEQNFDRQKRSEVLLRFLNAAENIEPFRDKKFAEIFSDEEHKRAFISSLKMEEFTELLNGVNGILRGKKKKNGAWTEKLLFLQTHY